MAEYTVKTYPLGDSCLCWSIGETIDIRLVRVILYVYGTLKQNAEIFSQGVRDIVPSYKALAVHFDPLRADVPALASMIDTLFEKARTNKTLSLKAGSSRQIPVVYDGPDLDRIALIRGLSISEIIRRHYSAEYLVAMIGFKPHFPYLIGLDENLATPRLDSPRKHVAAGSVGIGGAQTGIYPQDSPGGWNIIGRTDPAFLSDIIPGDSITFREVKQL